MDTTTKEIRRGRQIIKPIKPATEPIDQLTKHGESGIDFESNGATTPDPAGGDECLWSPTTTPRNKDQSTSTENPGISSPPCSPEKAESDKEQQCPLQSIPNLMDTVGSRRGAFARGRLGRTKNEKRTYPLPPPMEQQLSPKFSIASVDIPVNPFLDPHWLAMDERPEMNILTPVILSEAKKQEAQNWTRELLGSYNNWTLVDPKINSTLLVENWQNPDWVPWQTSDFLSRPDGVPPPTGSWASFEMGVSDSLRSQYEQNLKLVKQQSHGSLQYNQEEHDPPTGFLQVPPSEEEVCSMNTSCDKPNVNQGIYVYPMRLVNFTNTHIQFAIQVFNLPQELRITPSMFEAVVKSPSGVNVVCHVRKDVYKPNAVAFNPRMMKTFQGSFTSNWEVGLYTLKVRLVFPFVVCENTLGVVGDECTILVGRNYYKDGQRVPSIFYSLDHYQSPEGTLSANQSVWGLACDKLTNRLYFSERLTNQVNCMDPATGRILFKLNQTVLGGQLNRPTGISCDDYHRRIFISDKDNHRVACFTMDGDFLGAFGTRGHQNGCLNYPWDVAVSPLGTCVAVADSRNKRVQLFDMVGNFIDKFSVFERDPFSYKDYFDYPRGITFDGEGQIIYVTDFKTQNVLQIPLDLGTSRRLAPEGSLLRPQGIVVDQIGCLLVADSRNNCIRNISWDGQLLGSIRSVGGRTLVYPVNLALMAGGRVALLDGGGRVHIV